MGQKTHPLGFRLGITKDWKSVWFEQNQYRDFLLEDFKIRRFIEHRLAEAMIANIEIKRVGNRMTITINTARPGMVFGPKRQNLDALRDEIRKLTGGNKEITMLVEMVRVPELEAKLVAQNIARQLEQRVAHRRAMKRAVTQAMRLGALGVKVMVGGRLGGAEIARSEWYREGRVPLQTLTADIDYAIDVAKTIAGTCGVKVWIYKGDIQTSKRS